MTQDNTPSINIDDSLVQEFIDESLDMLTSLDSRFIELEERPGELEIIEAIFRPVHSIKGNSGFFGFVHVKHLAHELETLLDLMRKNKLSVSSDVINILLDGMDSLRSMLARVKQGEGELPGGDESVQAIIDRAKAAASGDDPQASWKQVADALDKLSPQLADLDDSIVQSFASLSALLAKLNPNKLTLSSKAGGDAAGHNGRQKLLDLVELLKTKPDDDARIAEFQDLLHKSHTDTDDANARAVIDELLETLEVFVGTIGLDELALAVLEEKLNTIDQAAIPSHDAPSPQAKAPGEEQAQAQAVAKQPEKTTGKTEQEPSESAEKKPAGKSNKSHDTHKTMRVSEAYIDKFLEYVGELIVVGDMYSNVYNQMILSQAERKLINTLKRTNETFNSLSQQLQNSIMSIRCVPVGTLLQKVPRLVRDVARMSNKQIEVTVTGDKVEMDKSLVDLLDAPLVHMVRNAADHGIEKPEARIAAGKPEQGHISVDITESDSRIMLAITDDGGGIRLDKIKAKAESLGLIAPGADLSEQALINCLFASGVSTAEQITDVSGRGVGMDVVKRMIDEAGGSISIQTKLGQGTTFSVELPKSVTTQIMSAYLLEVAGQKYALPLNCIQETVCIDPKTVSTVMQHGELTYHNDSAYPLIELKKILDIPSHLCKQPTDEDRQILVLVRNDKSTVAVKIDDVLGIQQIVLCKIDGMEDGNELIQGGAQMGDGTIVLILNPEILHDQSCIDR
jgi:two-component system chemotaxis sensor kinase CheA